MPWDGPAVRILEHRGHAAGHAALLVEDRGVLIAGDMVSDVLVPFLDMGGPDPIGDYLAGLDLLEGVTDAAEVFVPGHGSVGDGAELRARIALDRAYVTALRDGREPDDPRIGPSAPLDWMADVHRARAAPSRGDRSSSSARSTRIETEPDRSDTPPSAATTSAEGTEEQRGTALPRAAER